MPTSSRPKDSIVVSEYNADGDCTRVTPVVGKEAKGEVSALLERLEQRRQQTEKQPMTMDDALRELNVPEADRAACGHEISGAIGTLAGTEDHVDYTQTPFERRFFTEFRKRLPDGYAGSWLEREVISSELEYSYHDLEAAAKVVERIARTGGSIDDGEARRLLGRIEHAFKSASDHFCPLARAGDAVASMNEPYYLDRLAKAESLWEAGEVARTLERLGTNEAYPSIAALLTRLAVTEVRAPQG